MGSPVYLTFLDAKKAFDMLNHWTLFDKLLQRGVPSTVVRILMFWSNKHNFYVKWAGELSSSFKVSNGVRQGSVLSPTLFNLFLDDLSFKLRESYSGCYFNNQSYNHMFYADDAVLLAPSPHALQDLLDICNCYWRFATR